MKKSELFKLLEENGFFIIKETTKNNKTECYLHDKTKPGRRQRYSYVATVFVTQTGYIYNKKTYSNIQELKQAIKKYNSKLPFNSENYAPYLTKQCFTEDCLFDYLISLGFTQSPGYNRRTIEILDLYDNPYIELHISFDKDTNKTNGCISISISKYNRIISEFKDLQDAISSVNTLILPKILIITAQNLKMYSIITRYGNIKKDTEKLIISSTGITFQNIKEQTIEALERTLKDLKSE